MSEPRLLVEGQPPPPLGRGFSVVGKPVNRLDALEKVTGKAVYSGDIKISNPLYAKVLRSPYAHAKIIKIDSSKAEALPGVKAVIHKGNCPNWKMYFYLIPQTVFSDYVTWAGEEVAAVAAEDPDTARKAVDLIEVQYAPLPHVLRVEEALGIGATIVEALDEVEPTNVRAPNAPPWGNIYEGRPSVLKRGDPNKGFQQADLVIEDTYLVQFQYHAPMQTRTAIAQYDGDKLTIQESCQGLWPVREDLAKSLGLPEDKIRILVKYQGGGFGSKAGSQRYLQLVSKLAMLTKRPVKIELTRPEEFVSHPHRWGSKMWIKTGVKRDGTLTAVEGKYYVNIGTASTYGNQKTEMINTAFSLYECPNVHLEQYGVYTNAQLTGYMRGVMVLMGNFAIESHMDRLAQSLGVDPLSFRMKNYTVWGDQERKLPYSAKNLDKCLQLVTEAIGWSRRHELDTENRGRVKKKGIGLAGFFDRACGYPPFKANADVAVNPDGTVDLAIATVDIGGGESTVLPMIAAEELGVKIGRLRVHYGDTEGTRYGPATHANRITAEMGPAVLQAAYEARSKVFEAASQMLDAMKESLESRDDMIYVKDDPQRCISFDEVCETLQEPVKAGGSRIPNPPNYAFNVFGAKAAEVEVDTETGELRVLKVASAHEVGKALNPKLCTSQHYGGVVMGIGLALLEEPWIDHKTGVMLNPDLHQYRLPTVLETPEIVAFNVEAEDRFFAYSAKGLGNGTIIGVPSAIRNALAHALGIWLNDLPLTPDKILDALHGSKGL